MIAQTLSQRFLVMEKQIFCKRSKMYLNGEWIVSNKVSGGQLLPVDFFNASVQWQLSRVLNCRAFHHFCCIETKLL